MVSCSHKLSENHQAKEFKGILVVVGNEPFTSFALDDGKGHITRLKTNKNMETELNKLQGNFVRVYGIALDENEDIEVKSIKLFKDKLE